MIRTSTTEWQGDGPHGKGSLTTEGGVLRALPYSFKTRFEDGSAGTNPEELLGAAHAACFAMTVAFVLTEAGHAARQLAVTASVEISMLRSNALRAPGNQATQGGHEWTHAC